MTWQEFGGISEIFWTTDERFSFQRVGNYWRLYHGGEGSFLKEFRSFAQMQMYIREVRENGNH